MGGDTIYIPNELDRLTPNTGLVQAAPYASASSGAANWGGSGGETSREYLTLGHIYYIRQSDEIRQIKVYAANLTNLTAVYFKVWRRNESSTYDLVGTSENILSQLTAGAINTVTLTNTIVAQEGDLYGYRLEWSSGAQNFKADTGLTYVTTYHVINTTPSTTAYNWVAQTATAGTALIIEIYTQPPVFVMFGDSILGGHFEHVSYVDNKNAIDYSNPHKQVGRHLANKWNYTYQNTSVGSELSSTRVGRLTTDLLNLSPRFVVLERTDFGGGDPLFTWLGYQRTILDGCIANNIIPVVVLASPARNRTNAEHTIREIQNSALSSLVLGEYKTAVLVDTEPYIGQFRSGGDDGNLWDIKTGYTLDNIHFNATGKRYYAQAIIDAVNAWRINNMMA